MVKGNWNRKEKQGKTRKNKEKGKKGKEKKKKKVEKLAGVKIMVIFSITNSTRNKKTAKTRLVEWYSVHRWSWFMMKHFWPRNVYHVKPETLSFLSTRPLSDKIKRSLYYSHSLPELWQTIHYKETRTMTSALYNGIESTLMENSYILFVC